MGSRTKPNHGGSGAHSSRKSRPSIDSKKEFKSEPIKNEEELNRYLDADKIACLICGKEYKSLGHHLSRSHSTSARDYKVAFNIPVTKSLVGNDLKRIKSEISKKTWRENPAMEGVRSKLKDNIVELQKKATSADRKSSIPAMASKVRIKGAKKIQAESDRVNYRRIYLAEIEKAINEGKTLYSVAKSSHQIYEFSKRHPKDEEFSRLLSKVKKPDQLEAGTGKVLTSCKCCNKRFMTSVKRPSLACSRECSSKLRMVRVPKNCANCGIEMMLTPSDYKKIKNCRSDKCKHARTK